MELQGKCGPEEEEKEKEEEGMDEDTRKRLEQQDRDQEVKLGAEKGYASARGRATDQLRELARKEAETMASLNETGEEETGDACRLRVLLDGMAMAVTGAYDSATSSSSSNSNSTTADGCPAQLLKTAGAAQYWRRFAGSFACSTAPWDRKPGIASCGE